MAKLFNRHTGELLPGLGKECVRVFEFLDEKKHSRLAEEFEYRIFKYDYDSSGDGYHAIGAFLLCQRCQLPIPQWLQEWLASGFQKYVSSQDDESTLSDLEAFLGLSTQRDKRAPTHIHKPNGPMSITTQASRFSSIRYLADSFEFTNKVAAELVWIREKSITTPPMKPNTHDRLYKQFTESSWSELPEQKYYMTDDGYLGVLKLYDSPELSKRTRAKFDSRVESIKSGEFRKSLGF